MNAPSSLSFRSAPELYRRTMHFAYVQGLYWAMMFGVGECYFSIYATHIHAPGFFFGLMTGVPSLLGPLSMIVGANVVERTKKRKWLVDFSVIIQALCYAPLVFLTFVTSEQTAYRWLLAIMLVYFTGANFCGPAWNSWISVVVPAEERATYFARNSRAVAFISMITKLGIAGLLYLAAKEQEGYVFALAFGLAGISRIGSYINIQRMHEPVYEHGPEATFTFWQFIRRARESNFVRFVLFVTLINFGTQIAGPFFLPYAIYTLKFEQWQWVLIETIAGISSVATLLFWGTFSHRFGNKKTLQYTAATVSIIPLLWLISVNFYYLLAVNILSGLAWAGFNLCAFNYILEAVSAPKRARCVAYFCFLTGCGNFCGAMLGGWLNEILPNKLAFAGFTIIASSPFVYLLALSAAVRMTMGAFLIGSFRELREVDPFELKDLVFYISEMRFPVGLRFGAISDQPAKNAQVQSPVGAEKDASNPPADSIVK